MRDVPASMRTIWKSGLHMGAQRPIARVTVQHPTMHLHKYSLMSTYSWRGSSSDIAASYGGVVVDPSHGRKVNNTYANFMFGNPDRPKELPNVKSVAWQRSIDADVATCTIELLNTQRLPTTTDDPDLPPGTPLKGQLDQPGYFTPDRGGTKFSSRWGHTRNEWFGELIPDNMIRTYEGYGCDLTRTPEEDPNLILTGVWLIDRVEMSADGGMTITCRDVGRILLDQMCFRPVIPEDFYPCYWSGWSGEVYIGDTAASASRLKVSAQDSSNTPWISSGTVAGHKLSYAFDGNPNTYWLSIGNDRPSRRYAYEWVQCSVGKQTVSEVQIRTRKTGYTAYVSVKVGSVWQGAKSIDYNEDGVGRNDADIPYVKSTIISSENTTRVTFPAIKNVTAVRVTLGNLQNFGFGTYKYRAGIRDVQVFGASKGASGRTGHLTPGPAGSNPHRYRDYTDIVKLICAWAGFFQPATSYIKDIDNGRFIYEATPLDAATLGPGVPGRVWGDFQQTGTVGPATLETSNFDKQSLMDCIVYIRDLLGFLFYIDESGACQWRMPNVYDLGNWVTTLSSNPRRTKSMETIDENQILLSLTANLDSKNVREAFFVGTTNGRHSSWAPGFNPNPTGLRRVGGWTDANFETDGECRLMADMLSLRQLFSYRTDRVRVPGFPGIQIDDQVRIFERTAAEGYVHYVKGISSALDMESGEWTYDLDTHWLGYDPKSKWIFDPTKMSAEARRFVGALAPPDGDNPSDGPRVPVGKEVDS